MQQMRRERRVRGHSAIIRRMSDRMVSQALRRLDRERRSEKSVGEHAAQRDLASSRAGLQIDYLETAESALANSVCEASSAAVDDVRTGDAAFRWKYAHVRCVKLVTVRRGQHDVLRREAERRARGRQWIDAIRRRDRDRADLSRDAHAIDRAGAEARRCSSNGDLFRESDRRLERQRRRSDRRRQQHGDTTKQQRLQPAHEAVHRDLQRVWVGKRDATPGRFEKTMELPFNRHPMLRIADTRIAGTDAGGAGSLRPTTVRRATYARARTLGRVLSKPNNQKRQ